MIESELVFQNNSNKLVVYTALFGNYDVLAEPKEAFTGCDFICYTDQADLKSNIWQFRLVSKCDLPPNMMNRRIKILPHLYLNDYESSLYIDANISINTNPKNLEAKYLNFCDFAAPRHFLRNCLFKEAAECIFLKKGDPDAIKAQIDRYEQEHMPNQFGLSENNILLRKHNTKGTIQLMELWWEELNKGSMRDQLSLPYVLWKLDRSYNYMEESARGNSNYFSYNLHISELNKSFLNKLVNKIEIEYRRLFGNGIN